MIKLVLKTFVVSIVFFGVWFVFYFFTKWWDGLTATSGDTLTVDKWNSLVNEVNTLKNQNSAIFSWTQLDVIYCHMSWTATNSISTRITKSFIASDCWWRLPDDNYIPILKNIRPWWWLTTVETLKPWQTWYPWVSWRQANTSTGWNASVYYLKVK